MNLRCKVCGEKAAGFHFGAFTCEGCKSFFGRCCNNMSLTGECRNNEECVIDKKNRTSCKACRLRKCLAVGMSKNGSRYGRRSNWFKQFFQEAEHHAGRSKKPTSEADDARKRADTVVFSSAGTFADENEGKMCADLRSPTSGSSQVYFTYFPQHRLNKFISYGNGRETKFWLPNSTVPFAFFNNGYFERLLANKYDVNGESERGRRDNSDEDRNATDGDPLDLSRKRRSTIEDTTQPADAKRNSPLDLSIK